MTFYRSVNLSLKASFGNSDFREALQSNSLSDTRFKVSTGSQVSSVFYVSRIDAGLNRLRNAFSSFDL